MNRIELKKILLDAGVPSIYFSLFKEDGRKIDTVICLWPTDNKEFEFYIYERGSKYDIKIYPTENEGCMAVLSEFVDEYPALKQFIK